MSASAITSVNGNAAQIEHVVAYSSTITLALVSSANVNTCRFSFVSDSFGSITFPTITDTGFGNATFSTPADPTTGVGWGFLVQAIVNENRPNQAMWRFIVGIPNANGVIPICPDETVERDAILGWIKALNQLLNIDVTGIGPLGNGNIIIGGPSGNQIRVPVASDIPALNNATLLTVNDERATLPNSLPIAVNLGGGSALSLDVSGGGTYISAPFGTTAGTYMQGNDSRIAGGVQTSRTISTTAPLTGGGDLSANRTFAISYPTTGVGGIVPPLSGVNLPLVINGAGTGITWAQIPWSTGIGGIPAPLSSPSTILTGPLTPGQIPYASTTTALGDSPIRVVGGYDVSIAGVGQLGSPFLTGAGFKHIALGTTYWDGSEWVTPGVGGTNAIALMSTDVNGIWFNHWGSIGSGNRSVDNATLSSFRRFGINETGVYSNVPLTVADGSQAAGYIGVCNVNGTLTWTSISTLGLVKIGGDIGGTSAAPTVISISGSAGTVPITASTAAFASSITAAKVSQSQTTGVPHDLTVEAQSATTNSYAPANLNLNAGSNQSGIGKGSIQLGYSGATGAYGTIGATGAAFLAPLSCIGTITSAEVSPVETHVLTRTAGFAVAEDVQWFQASSSSTTPVTFDITTWLGVSGIPDNHSYHATLTICADGLPNAVITAAATWKKTSGTLAAQMGVAGINTAALVVGAANPTNNTMRFQVTPPSSTATTWTCKAQIIQT